MFKQFIKNNLIYVGTSVLVGILNWGFGLIILKFSGKDVSSIYFGFNGLLVIFALPSSWISLMTIKYGKDFAKTFLNLIYLKPISTVVLSLSSLVGLWYAFKLTNLPVELFLLLPIIAITALAASYYKGVIQNTINFFMLAQIGFVEVISKIVVFFLLFPFLHELWAVFAALTAQFLIGLLLSAYLTKPLASNTNNSKMVAKTMAVTLGYAVCFMFITNIDAVFARINLDLTSNYNYLAMLQLAKILVFASTAIISVLIPTLEKFKHEPKQLLKLAGLSALANLVFSIAIVLFGAFGFEFISSKLGLIDTNVQTLIILLVGTSLLCFSQIPFSLLLVYNNVYIPLIAISAIVLQVLLYVFWAHSLLAFCIVYAVVGLLIGISSSLILILQKNLYVK